jgi:Mrp family chromosome partitioning ATPase
MLDALRRLEETNQFVTPAANAVPLAARRGIAPPAAVSALSEMDDLPFEPSFGPVVAWDRAESNYATHSIDEALEVLDCLASDAAELALPARMVTEPIAAPGKKLPILQESAALPVDEASTVPITVFDEIDPIAVVNEHTADEDGCNGSTAMVGLDDATVVATDVESTIQFAEHWATIALEEFGVPAAPAAIEFPPPVDDYELPKPPAETTTQVELTGAAIEPTEVVEQPAIDVDAIETSAAVERDVAPAPAAPPARPSPTPTKPPVEADADRPQPSPSELAAMLDLNNPKLSAQYLQLGERILAELTTTTKTCAAIVSVEHQPHVTDVSLRTAMKLCHNGKQVLLIDAALGDKQLTNGLAMPVEFGLAEVLKGRVPWQQAVRATATRGLCVLPAGRLPPPRLSDDDQRLKEVLKELISQWDLVLLDGGSLTEPSTRHIAIAARNVYLVVRLGETLADAAARGAQSLASPEIALRGCIVTNA